MVKVVLTCDTRERAIQDSINNEFTKPPTFAKTRGTMICNVKQIAVADYTVEVDGYVAAVFERKTLKDYGASFKDNRHSNKAKLLNARNLSGCQIYYIIEGPLNPDYETEYAGIKYKNILASIQDLMIKDNIFVIRTKDGQHTAQELRMFCESQIRVKTELAKTAKEEIDGGRESDCTLESDPELFSSSDTPANWRSPISFEELQTKADLTPEEKLYKCRVEAWKSLPGIGNSTAIRLASLYSFAEWVTGELCNPETEIGKEMRCYTYNGRRNNKVVNLLSSKPNAEMQSKILAATNGLTLTSASEIIQQYSLEQLLTDTDFSMVRYGKNKTKLTKNRITNIKFFLMRKNLPFS